MSAQTHTTSTTTSATTTAPSEARRASDSPPGRVLSGAMHYFRVLPEQWRQRLSLLRAMGLDTVETYVPHVFSTE